MLNMFFTEQIPTLEMANQFCVGIVNIAWTNKIMGYSHHLIHFNVGTPTGLFFCEHRHGTCHYDTSEQKIQDINRPVTQKPILKSSFFPFEKV